MHNDEYFMKRALAEAVKAADCDEVPVGAVVVKGDHIIGRGHNLREKTNDPTAHAEIIAIKKACKKLGSWRLDGCRIYVTVEPCSMCAGTILWTRMTGIIFGAKDPKGGACGTSYNLFEQKGINHRLTVRGGVLEEQAQQTMKQYFKSKL